MSARLRALIVKEFLAILRNKKSRIILIVPPIMQLFIFSYAATFEVNNVALAVFNEDIGAAGRELVARFTGAPVFNLVATLTRESEMADIVDSGRVSLVLHLKQDFSRNLAIGETARVQAIVDGRRSNVGLVVLGYAQAIVRDFSLDWAAGRGRAMPPARLVMRSWFNPNLSSQWFIIPGLVALLTMLVTVLMTAMSIARERELGTFEQLLVTPLRPFEIMVGKIIPAVALGLTEGTIIVIFAIFFFEVPFAGSLIMLYVSLSVFLLSVVGFGLMISSLAKTQQQAIFGVFLFVILSVLLSGFATPIASMSEWVQYITYLNPMRYILIVVRGLFLQGLSPDLVLVQLRPMALIGVVTLIFAMRMFRRRLY